MKASTSEIASIEQGSHDGSRDLVSPARPTHILLAFIATFCPLVVIAILLCLSVSLNKWTVSDSSQENAAIPMTPLKKSSFFTQRDPNEVILISSWTSNIAQFATAPFMLLFSFLVAFDIANRPRPLNAENDDVKQLLDGQWSSLWEWMKRVLNDRNYAKRNGIRVAAAGALISFTLTLLLILGDKLLQGTISSSPHRLYGVVDSSDPNIPGRNSFVLGDYCQSTDSVPCSINKTASPWDLRDPPSTYRILDNGIFDPSNNSITEDSGTLEYEDEMGKSAEMQIVTYSQNETADQHVFFFNPYSALEGFIPTSGMPSDVDLTESENFGWDYLAQTTSMVTRCYPITKACGMHNLTDNNSASIMYHCSDIFSGNLSLTPTNGLEQLKGWNTSFYDPSSGSARRISMTPKLNPFYYNVTAVVNSLDLQDLIDFGDPQAAQGSLVDAGNERIAFALSCTSHIYNLKYTFINGTIGVLETSLADPWEADIINAPLQSSFGSYALYQQASMAVLLTNTTVADAMALSFSQIGMALAVGAYVNQSSDDQLWHADVILTEIPKGPFFFLVICLFLYALLVLVFTYLAISMRRRPEVRETQAELIPQSSLEVKELVKSAWGKISELLKTK